MAATNMLLIVVAVVLVVALAGAGTVTFMSLMRDRGEGEAGGSAEFSLEAKPYFFSVAENKFYGELATAAGELGFLIFPKVGLNDVFKDKPGAPKGQYNRYAQMHVDFLLVSKKDYRPVAGIELDGASHQGQRQMARDQKKNAVFKAAGLPLVRFINHSTITPAELRQKLEDVMGLSAGAA